MRLDVIHRLDTLNLGYYAKVARERGNRPKRSVVVSMAITPAEIEGWWINQHLKQIRMG